MPKHEPTIRPIKQIATITTTAPQFPAAMAAISAFVPAIMAFAAATVALMAALMPAAVALAAVIHHFNGSMCSIGRAAHLPHGSLRPFSRQAAFDAENAPLPWRCSSWWFSCPFGQLYPARGRPRVLPFPYRTKCGRRCIHRANPPPPKRLALLYPWCGCRHPLSARWLPPIYRSLLPSDKY